MTHSTPSAMSREALTEDGQRLARALEEGDGIWSATNEQINAAALALAPPQPDTAGGKPGEGEISDAQLHAAMDAFYPGENWRVDLGCARESSLRDMRSALQAASVPVNSEAEREGWKPGDLALNARYERDGVYPAFRETAFVQRIKISHGHTYLGFGPDGGHTYLSDQFDKVRPSAPTPQQGLGERANAPSPSKSSGEEA